MTTGNVRWAIVGTGGIGRRTVGDLRRCDTAAVVAVTSRSRAAAVEFARAWDLPLAFDDYAALCASPDVDAIYIGTPHATHFDYARRALLAGKLWHQPVAVAGHIECDADGDRVIVFPRVVTDQAGKDVERKENGQSPAAGGQGDSLKAWMFREKGHVQFGCLELRGR